MDMIFLDSMSHNARDIFQVGMVFMSDSAFVEEHRIVFEHLN